MNLFESGKTEWPPVKTMVQILLHARESLGISEDDWTLDEMCKVRDMFPVGYRDIDPSLIAKRMRRLRKDKLLPKIKSPMSFVDRMEKMMRDFNKNRERKGTSHLSEKYISYISSDEWRKIATQHKERVNWRCQFCDCFTSKLDVHHTSEGYRNLGREEPWHILAVCHDPCHTLADMLREGVLKKSLGEESKGFFEDEV